MTRLISQYEVSFGCSEEDEAQRLRDQYGWQRACTLAAVFEETSVRVYKAFWFRVGCLLAAQPDGVIPATLRKEREASVSPFTGQLSITIENTKISKAEFRKWLRSHLFAKA